MNVNKIQENLITYETKKISDRWNLEDFKDKNIATFGTFDLFHIGHRKIIDHCIEITGSESKVIIAVSSDEWNSKKGKSSSQNEKMRISKIMNEYPSATVIIEDHENPEESWPEIWDEYNIDLIVMGGDHFKNLSYINESKSKNEKDMKIVFFERTPKISSTLLREEES